MLPPSALPSPEKEASPVPRDLDTDQADLARILSSLEASVDGIWDMDLTSGKLYVSPHWYAALGYDHVLAEESGAFWNKLMHPEDYELVRERTALCVAGTASNLQVEVRVRSATGGWVWVRSNGRLIGRGSAAPRMVGTLTNINQQKIAEARLEESSLIWRGLMEMAPVGIFRASLDGECLFANRAFCDFLGLDEAAVLGYGWVNAITSDERPWFLKQWRENMDTNGKLHLQFRHRRPNGEEAWAIGKAVRSYNPAGEVSGYIGTIQDISAMRDANERLRTFLDNLPAGAVYVENGRVTMNRTAEKITGISRDEVTELDQWFRLLHGKNWRAHREGYDRHRTLGFVGKSLFSIRRRDGTRRGIEFTGMRGEKFDVWHLNDVTDQVAAQEKFKLIFDSAADAHFVLENGVVTDCNPAAVALFAAKSKAEILAEPFLHFSPKHQTDGSDSATRFKEIESAAVGDGTQRFDWCCRTFDGKELSIELTVSPIRTQEHTKLLVVARDFTAAKVAQAKILQSSKMASLGEMAGGLAHEINNPLTIIKTRADQILLRVQRGESLPEAWVKQRVTLISETVERIAKIIKGLRSFARDSSSEPLTDVRVGAIIDDTLSFCAQRFKSYEIDLREVVPSPDIMLVCRPVQISQVLLNLLNNAFDAVNGLPERWVQLEVGLKNEMIEFSCTDSGAGVPPELREKIMQPFFTTKEVGRGTGLGLSISRGIVENHGGKLWLDEHSRNTRFVFRLPLNLEKKAFAKRSG